MAKTITADTVSNPITADGYAAGRPVGGATAGKQMPTIPNRSRPFYLGFPVKNWELVKTAKGFRLMPVPSPLYVHPGANWVEQRKKGVPADDSKMLARMRKRMPVFEDVEEYLREVDAANGPAYFLEWERVKAYDDGDWEQHFDKEGWWAWLQSKIDDGQIAHPRESVISAMRFRLNKAITRAQRTPHHELAKAAIKNAEVRLEGLNEAVAFLKGDKAKDKKARKGGEP